jgi:hypothetical protein
MTPCRVFPGAKNNQGYGVVRRQGRNWLLHRWIMFLAGHEIQGKVVMHVCDNPPCFRYNTQDMLAKGRGRGNTKPSFRRKLTTEQAREIVQSSEPAYVLAKRFGIHPSAARQIRRGETYKEASCPTATRPSSAI